MMSSPTAEPGNICLDGHIDVPAERLDAVRKALPEHIRLTRHEAGCRFFNVTEEANVEGRFQVSEIFVDQTAFDQHQQRAAQSAWGEVAKGLERHYVIRTIQ